MAKPKFHVPPGDYLCCVDGPLAGQWFTRADWQERVDVAKRMDAIHTERPPSPCLHYGPDPQIPNRIHPNSDSSPEPETWGVALIYRRPTRTPKGAPRR